MKGKFSKLISEMVFLRFSPRSGSRFLSGNHVGRRLLGALCMGFLGIYSLTAAQGPHKIIMVDTSGSMKFGLHAFGKLPKPGSPARITAVQTALKKFIDEDVSIGIDTTLHLYEFNEGLLKKTKLKIKIDRGNRGKAKDWVDKLKLKKHRVQGRDLEFRTYLYQSIDEALKLASELKEDRVKDISLLIIGDGKHDGPMKPFKNMAEVLKKHNATIKVLNGKDFFKIVDFKLNQGDAKALHENGFDVTKNPGGEKKVDLNKISPPVINAAFELLHNGEVVKNGAVLWAGKNPLQIMLKNKTTVQKMDGKVKVAVPRLQWPKGVEFLWNINKKSNAVQGDDLNFKAQVGPSQVALIIKQKGKPNIVAGPLEFTIEQVQVKLGIANKGAKPGEPFAVKQGVEVNLEWAFVNGVGPDPKDVSAEWDYGDGKKGKDSMHTYQDPNPAGKPYKAIGTIVLPSGEKLSGGFLEIQVLPAVLKAFAKPINPWPGQVVAFTTPAKDVEKVTWIIAGERIPADAAKNFSVDHAFDAPGPHDVKVEITPKGLEEPLKTTVKVMVKGVDPKVEILSEGQPYIGQLIMLKTTNAAVDVGAEQFPLGYKSELIDGKGNKFGDPAKLTFAKPGQYQIKALVTLPGVKKPFPSKSPAEINVKPVIIEIGAGKKEK